MSWFTVDSTAPLNPFYGWQLLYYSIQNTVRKKSDLIIALAHFLITKQYNLRSIDSNHVPDLMHYIDLDAEGSELLPEHWNRDPQKYAMHYICNGDHYVLLARLTHRDLVVNLQNWTTKRMSISCLQPDELVHCICGKLDDCMPNVELIIDRLRNDLVDPIIRGTRASKHNGLLDKIQVPKRMDVRQLAERHQSKSTMATYSLYQSIISEEDS